MRGIHPFPARMAPDAIADVLETLPDDATVLDPMCGSGVVVRLALLSGRHALGFDIDPLAVLMSKVWTSNKSLRRAEQYAAEVAGLAASVRLADVRLPWIDGCRETREFVEYWFARPQRNDLRRLSWQLMDKQIELPNHIRDCLWLALSRIVITRAQLNKNREDILENTFRRGLPKEAQFEVSREFKDDMRSSWNHGVLTTADAFSHYYSHFTRDQDFFESNLARLKTPVKVVWGENDLYIKKEMGVEFAERINAELTLLPGIGHYPHLQVPKQVIEEVRTSFW